MQNRETLLSYKTIDVIHKYKEKIMIKITFPDGAVRNSNLALHF